MMKFQILKRQWNILIVEDDPIIQRIHAVLLQDLGCQVNIVGNGQAALQAHQENLYDAILMDLGLPDMNGIEIARIIRLREVDKKKTPIIIVTAHTGKDIKEKCLKNGVNVVLRKPLGEENLNTILFAIVNKG
ncbi:MAG TPA: response regulator [Gammaproteobacteria bacterium]|nr:response regulator [Gammaproteobacteria bacterium]